MVETPSAPPATPARAPRPEQTTPLLSLITQRSLDADYEHVAARRRAEQGTGAPRPSAHPLPRGTAALVLLVFGLLVTVAAVQTSRNASVDEASRAHLIDQITLRRAAVADLQRQLSKAQAEQLGLTRSLTRLSTANKAAQARLTRVGARAGLVPVRGPGIVATVTSAPGSDANQMVRDSDLAQLADALWSAGAEAISVNGERLTVLTSFRNVGTGILVNNHPVNPPFVFSAIGDPSSLAADLLTTPAGGRWYALKNALGFDFQVKNDGDLSLPAATTPHLRSARVATPKDLDTRTQGDSPS
jgi:uncharacterized protein YlxW (UPF0749 family)